MGSLLQGLLPAIEGLGMDEVLLRRIDAFALDIPFLENLGLLLWGKFPAFVCYPRRNNRILKEKLANFRVPRYVM